MTEESLSKFEKLSPFELKDKLIHIAKKNSNLLTYNAGRGNPNWIATTPRYAFFLLGQFALQEAQSQAYTAGIGFHPSKIGLYYRFQVYAKKNSNKEGMLFLKDAVDYAIDQLDFDQDSWMSELVTGVLGDNYPRPDRILPHTERVVYRYLQKTMGDLHQPYDLFATEGGTAAMRHCFDSLMTNNLLKKGDTIALAVPTFTPYLEMPHLPDYDLHIIYITADHRDNWQYPQNELDKLKNPKIKALFIVNPGNPTSYSIAPKIVTYLVNLVKNYRPDLMILSDDVYGSFIKGFQSLAVSLPHNTLLVYSFSKHMGCTGWRLAVVALHQDNIFDQMISRLPEKEKKQINERYQTLSTQPENIKFIDRMVADSRAVALNHTAGLSLPQQIQMTLFSLFFLLEPGNQYIQHTQSMLHNRLKNLYHALDLKLETNARNTEYYIILDIIGLAEKYYDKQFAKYLEKNFHPLKFIFDLAEQKSVVLLNGDGFGAAKWSVRVSLANLNESDYTLIGQAIKQILYTYHKEYMRISEIRNYNKELGNER
jgi:aspartate 4-decarboxylase